MPEKTSQEATCQAHVADEDQLAKWAAHVARAAPPSGVVGLTGTLGAGKTRFVQAFAEAWGVERADVTSPTFVICQVYDGENPIRHVDLYRVRDEDEFWELGAEEWFDEPGVTLLEWADRYAHCLPSDRLDIHLEITGPTSRSLILRSSGPLSFRWLQRVTIGTEFG